MTDNENVILKLQLIKTEIEKEKNEILNSNEKYYHIDIDYNQESDFETKSAFYGEDYAANRLLPDDNIENKGKENLINYYDNVSGSINDLISDIKENKLSDGKLETLNEEIATILKEDGTVIKNEDGKIDTEKFSEIGHFNKTLLLENELVEKEIDIKYFEEEHSIEWLSEEPEYAKLIQEKEDIKAEIDKIKNEDKITEDNSIKTTNDTDKASSSVENSDITDDIEDSENIDSFFSNDFYRDEHPEDVNNVNIDTDEPPEDAGYVNPNADVSDEYFASFNFDEIAQDIQDNEKNIKDEQAGLENAYDDIPDKVSTINEKIIPIDDSMIKLSSVGNVYDDFNHGIYAVEIDRGEDYNPKEYFGFENGEFIHLKGDDILGNTFSNNERDKISASIGDYEKENPQNKIELVKNVVSNEVNNSKTNVISVGVVDVTAGSNIKNIESIGTINASTLNTKHNIDVIKTTGLFTDERTPAKSEITDEKLSNLKVSDSTIKEIRTNQLQTKLEYFEKGRDLKDFVNFAKAHGFITKDDESIAADRRNEYKSEIASDSIKANIAIIRLLNMPAVIDVAKIKLTADYLNAEDNNKAEAIKEKLVELESQKKIGEVFAEKIFTNTDAVKFSDVKDTMYKMSSVSNYIKDDLPKIENGKLEATGFSFEGSDGKIYPISLNGLEGEISTKAENGEKVRPIANDTVKVIENATFKPFRVTEDGRFEKIELRNEVYIKDNETIKEKSASVISEAKEVARQGYKPETIERVLNEIGVERSKDNIENNNNVDKDNDSNTTKDNDENSTKDNNKDTATQNNTDKREEKDVEREKTYRDSFNTTDTDSVHKQQKSETYNDKATRRREKDDDDLEYDSATGQWKSNGHDEVSPADAAIMAPALIGVALAFLGGPFAIAALGIGITAVGKIIKGVHDYEKKQHEEKVTKEENEKDTKIEKESVEKGSSFKERMADKIHAFGEKMEKSRGGVDSTYQKDIEKQKVVTGVGDNVKDALEKDIDKSTHPNIDKISEGLHKATEGGVLGKIFDKIAAPFNKVSADNTKYYLDNASIRQKDIIKQDIGLKGDTIKSAFEKISALRHGIGKDFSTVDKSIGRDNISTKNVSTDRYETDKFRVSDFIKSAFKVIGNISLGTMIASTRIDISGKTSNIDGSFAKDAVKTAKESSLEDVIKEMRVTNTNMPERNLSNPDLEARKEGLKEILKENIAKNESPDISAKDKIANTNTINSLNSRIEKITDQQISNLENKKELSTDDMKGLKDLYQEKIDNIDEKIKDEEKYKSYPDVEQKIKDLESEKQDLIDKKADITEKQIEKLEGKKELTNDEKNELKDLHNEKEKYDNDKAERNSEDFKKDVDDKPKDDIIKERPEIETKDNPGKVENSEDSTKPDDVDNNKEQVGNIENPNSENTDEGNNQDTKVSEQDTNPQDNASNDIEEEKKKQKNDAAGVTTNDYPSEVVSEKDEKEDSSAKQEEDKTTNSDAEEILREQTEDAASDEAGENITTEQAENPEEEISDQDETTTEEVEENDTTTENVDNPTTEDPEAVVEGETVAVEEADETEDTIDVEEPVETLSSEEADNLLDNPDDLKDYITDDNNQVDTEKIAELVEVKMGESENPKEDFEEIADKLRDAGVDESDIHEIANEYESNHDVGIDYDPKLDNNNDNEQSALSSLVDACVDFASNVLDKAAEAIDNIFDSAIDALFGIQDVITEESWTNPNIDNNIEKVDDDALNNMQDQLTSLDNLVQAEAIDFDHPETDLVYNDNVDNPKDNVDFDMPDNTDFNNPDMTDYSKVDVEYDYEPTGTQGQDDTATNDTASDAYIDTYPTDY